jgi:hypothetical protein
MRRHLLRAFELASVPEVFGNTRRPERVIPDPSLQPAGEGAPPDHPVGICVRQRISRPRESVNMAEHSAAPRRLRMDDLHSRAIALLRGPCCISRDEPRPKAVGLIQQYVDGTHWQNSELLTQLSRCLRYAQTRAAGPEGATGPGRDALYFYKKAAALLQEIQAEVSAHRP